MTTDPVEETADLIRRMMRFRRMSQREIARYLNVSVGSVSDCLLGKPMSDNRLNTLRLALSLPLVRRKKALLSEGEFVSRQQGGKERGYVSRQVRLTPEEAAWIDACVKEMGFRSFSEWFRRVSLPDFMQDAP